MKKNIINLEFPNTLTRLTDNPYGRRIFQEQVEKNIKYDMVNVIQFPDHIIRASSSFVQGFFTEIVQHLGYDKLKEYIEIKSINQSLIDSVWKNLF